MEGYLATVMLFAGTFAPRNWSFCAGQLLQINLNTALFSLLNTIYGGDGRTTFGLPDLRGRMVMGAGSGPGLTNRVLGQKGGVESNVLNTANLPAHTHALKGTTSAATQLSPQGNLLADGSRTNLYFPATGTLDATLAGTSIANSSGPASTTLTTIPPFQAINYVICIIGMYPSRA